MNVFVNWCQTGDISLIEKKSPLAIFNTSVTSPLAVGEVWTDCSFSRVKLRRLMWKAGGAVAERQSNYNPQESRELFLINGTFFISKILINLNVFVLPVMAAWIGSGTQNIHAQSASSMAEILYTAVDQCSSGLTGYHGRIMTHYTGGLWWPPEDKTHTRAKTQILDECTSYHEMIQQNCAPGEELFWIPLWLEGRSKASKFIHLLFWHSSIEMLETADGSLLSSIFRNHSTLQLLNPFERKAFCSL